MFILLIIFLFIAAAMVGYKAARRDVPTSLVALFAILVVVYLVVFVIAAATS